MDHGCSRTRVRTARSGRRRSTQTDRPARARSPLLPRCSWRCTPQGPPSAAQGPTRTDGARQSAPSPAREAKKLMRSDMWMVRASRTRGSGTVGACVCALRNGLDSIMPYPLATPRALRRHRDGHRRYRTRGIWTVPGFDDASCIMPWFGRCVKGSI